MVETSEVDILQADGGWLRARTTAVGAGAMLRMYRERAKVSGSQLATIIGCNHSFISRLERGQRQLQAHWIPPIAAALAMTDAERDALLVAGGYAPAGELLDAVAKALAGCNDPERYALGVQLLGVACDALSGGKR